MEKIYKYYHTNPLKVIIIAALAIRLLSVFFSRGYGMHDDHFLIIESSRSWVEGNDYNKWLPWSQEGTPTPSGHSLFYPGLMFFLQKTLNFIGISDLNLTMYIVRFLHALWSLLIVYFGFKITSRFAGGKVAEIAGWALALSWFMPWLSVRNLVEVVCIPFLMWGTWIYVKEEKPSWKIALASGLVMGLAFSVRYQTAFFIGGFVWGLLFMKRWRDTLLYSLGIILSISVIQNIPDLLIWHRPFAELTEYVRYNMENATTYFDQPWYNYILVILVLLLPPFSVFLFGGFFYRWRNYPLLILPSLCFLIFHSAFPNKQERFILTIIPFVLIKGIIGILNFCKNHKTKPWLKKTFRISLYFALAINTIAIIPVSVHYSKKARVETMVFLKNYPDTQSFIIENTNEYGVCMPPKAYCNNTAIPYFEIAKNETWEKNYNSIINSNPSFIIFEGDDNLEARVEKAKEYFPNLKYVTMKKEAFIDALMQKINPVNSNYSMYIYQIEK